MPQGPKRTLNRLLHSIRTSFAVGFVVLAASLMVPQAAKAQRTWYVKVGAETQNHAGQADAFLPNEVWINKDDSIQWVWQPKNEPHTVTFLKPGQTRPTPPPPIGPPVGPPFIFGNECPSPNPYAGGSTATYDGSDCVSSGALSGSAASPTFTVTFPNEGNYRLVCLIHANMNGTVHVLSETAPLPYLQWDYDRQARDEARDILRDADTPREETNDFRPSENEVIMTGEVTATAGGRQYLTILRFFNKTIRVHVGDTVEWVNLDPTEPHTVTFGDEPANPQSIVNATQDGDGALHGTINSGSDSVSSGFLQAAPEDAAGRAQSAVFSPGPPANTGLTRIRITFTHAGTYQYHCALHDEDGMVGTVIVK
jgi:plastocyanin